MPTVAITECGHRRDVVGIGTVGHEIIGSDRRLFAVDHFIGAGFGDGDLLTHVSDDLVSHDKDGLAEALCHVESLDRERVALGDRAGSIRDSGVVAVRSPFGLHDVGLGNLCGKTGRGAAALDVGEDHGDLRDISIAEELLFKGDSGA